MKTITLSDFEKNHKRKANRWLGLLSLCLILLFGPFTLLYGQGNTCIAPLNVSSLPYTFSGDTSSYGDDYDTANIPAVATGAIVTGTNYTYYLNGDDVVFKITPSINGTMTINTSFTATYGGVFVFTGCPFASTLGYNVSSATGVKEISNLPVVANTVYYIVLSTWATPQSSAFTLNITGTPGLLTPPEACIGTPVGGTASITPNGGNAGAVFTANATGVTLASGLAYQWQKSIAGTWQDIAGATAIYSSITAEAGAVGTTTDYRLKVTCTASTEIAYSTIASYTISLTYCVPTVSLNNSDEIINFTLSNLNNTSAPSEGVAGYKNYSGLLAPAQLLHGVPYIASLTGGAGSGTHGAAIWIDYNNNGTFETTERVAFIGNTIAANATVSFPEFIVPTGTALGIYRLRVQHHYNVSGDLLNPCVATSQFSETEDYSVQVFPVPTCLQPSGLMASNVTSTTADLAWTSTGNLFTIEWGTQGFVPGAGTTVNGIALTSYTLNNLQPNNSYSYYVRRDCGATDGVSLWTGPYNFKTACGSVNTFYENFDTALTGTTAPMPSCWSKAGNGTTYITTGSVAPNSPANRLYMLANGAAATPTQGFAIMPAVANLQANTHRLKFKAYATTTGKTMEIGYFTDLMDISSFVTLETIQLPGTAATATQEFTVEPSGIPAGVTNLVFRNNAPTASTTLYIDDVIWEALPLCNDIVSIQTQTFNSTSAIITWDQAGAEIGWEYVYAVSTVTDPSTLTPVAVSGNAIATLTSLTPNTTYKIWIRSNCGAGALGNWQQNPHTFTTSCTAATTFSENFDSYTLTGSTNPLPSCWTRFGNTGSSYIITGSLAPLTPPNKLYLSASTTTNALAVLPPVSNLQAETHRLKFKGYCTTADKVIEIGYFELAGDPTSFVVLETFPLPSTAQSTASEFSYTPQFVPDGIESIAFRVNGPAFATTTTMYIDDVVWEPIPLCADLNDITIANVGTTTADIEWYTEGSETAWDYVYAVNTVTSPVGLTPTTINNNPFATLTDLTPSTTYNFWVRSNCGSGIVGTWSAVQTFTTTCVAETVLPYTIDFESVTTPNIPICTSRQNVGTGNNWETFSATANGFSGKVLRYNYNTTNAANAWFYTNSVTLEAGIAYKLSYKYGNNSTTYVEKLKVAYGVSGVDTAMINELADHPSVTGGTAQNNSLFFTPTTSGTYVFGFNAYSALNQFALYLDNIVIEVAPTCLAPLIESVMNVTSTTATVTWSSASTATNGFEYFLTTDTAIVPNASTVPTGSVAGSVSSLDLATLNTQTTYKFYVRALCSASDISAWSEAATFTTACGEVAVFSENFDTSATGSANPLPTCWLRAGNGNTYVTTGGATPGTPPNRLYMFASGTATVPTVGYAIMPPVSNLQANTHRLKFKAYASTTGKYLEIGYLTDITDLTSFVLLETVDLPGTTAATAQTFTINPENIPAGINSLTFRNPGTPTASTTAYIDDVIWEAKPTVAPECATNVVATPNATCGNFATILTWTANPATDGYYLTIGTTAGGTDVLNNQNIGAVTSYNFIGNIAANYYYTVTPFNSAGSATGCTEQTFATAANGCYCTSVPTSNDGTGITNVQIGTQNFINGDVMYFDHTATVVDLAQGINANLQVTFGTGYTYGTNVWIDLNDNYNFEVNELVYTGESLITNPTTLNASFLMPANAALGNHRMRIVATDVVQVPANPCYGGTYGVTLDFKVNVIPIPTCLAPSGLTVDIASVTTTTAIANWTASTSVPANGYEYYYTTTNTPPTASTPPSGSVAAGITTANLTALAPSTIYRLYVRAACSANDYSAWTQAVLFTTLCDAAPLPYTINFESVTVPNLPLCTSNQNLGTGNNWETFSNNGNGFTTKVLRYAYNSAAAANTWFFTNNVSLVAGTQYSITYQYGNNSTTFTEKLKVGYGTSASNVAMTTILADHTSIIGGTLQNNSVTFTPTTSGTYVFGFNAYSDVNEYYLYVDNIVIEEVLGAVDFNTNKFTAYPNPVKDKLNIRYNENISNVAVFNLLGQQLFVKNINATEGQVDMSNLASGTYLVRVNSGDKVETIKVIKE
jgi:hypothetical protein